MTKGHLPSLLGESDRLASDGEIGEQLIGQERGEAKRDA